jgi:hypothetical protein
MYRSRTARVPDRVDMHPQHTFITAMLISKLMQTILIRCPDSHTADDQGPFRNESINTTALTRSSTGMVIALAGASSSLKHYFIELRLLNCLPEHFPLRLPILILIFPKS